MAAETFEDKPCRTCGGSERYSRGGVCVACQRARSARRIRGLDARRRAGHRDEMHKRAAFDALSLVVR